MKRTHAVMTLEEWQRATWIDFEGFEEQPPAVMGILEGDELEQVVLDPRLAEAARAKGLRVSTLAAETAGIVGRCRAEGRVLVAYSSHEREVIATHCGVDVSDVYRDARLIAKRWWNRTHPDDPAKDRSLKAFLARIGYPVPAHLGDRKTTHRLRGVLAGLAAKGTYEALTTTAKGKWTRLLAHNAVDCRGMRALVAAALGVSVPASGRAEAGGVQPAA